MYTVNLRHGVLFVVLLATTLLAGQMTPLAALPPTQPDGPAAPESIAGSYVYFNGVVSPDDCFTPAQVQTFCMQAISYTTDWDWVASLWQRFPDDWTVHDVYVYDTPYCVLGGNFDTFGWSTTTSNEVVIYHPRYHANPEDTCTAYYCFVVTSGHASPGTDWAKVSWYWVSGGQGSPPYRPCSSDGYTPAGHTPCDEMTTPPAWIPACPASTQPVYLPAVFKNWR